MFKILAVATLSAAFGLLLASGLVHWQFPASWIGVAAMLASAWAARRYWQSLRPEDGPGTPERELWHGLASYSLIAGFLGLTLWQMGPALTLDTLAGHRMGIDSWTLVIGMIVSYWIAKDPEPRQDERDALFTAQARRAGYVSLVTMLVVATPLLAFSQHTVIERFNQPMLAHLVIEMLTVNFGLQQAMHLFLYARDADAGRDAP